MFRHDEWLSAKISVFGRLSVMTAQASRLVQVRHGVLIGQRACMRVSVDISVRGAIDSTHAGSCGRWH